MQYNSVGVSSQVDEFTLFKAYLNNITQQTHCTDGQLNAEIASLGSIKFKSNFSAYFPDRLNLITWGTDQSGLTVKCIIKQLPKLVYPWGII